jgi:ribulose 1,5-bisphosphate carboxylase large subunit-like protein
MDFIRVTYAIRLKAGSESGTDVSSLEAEAAAMAREGSYGTWTDTVGGEIFNEEQVRADVGAVLEHVDRDTRTAVIAFPEKNFDWEWGQLTLVLNTIGGDILGRRNIEDATVINVDFPQSWLQCFKGPTSGIAGVRRLTGVRDRPLVAISIKPRLGLTPEQLALLAKAVAVGGGRGEGVDIIEDDERLLNPEYCPVVDRVRAIRSALDEVRHEVGTKLYSVNVSSRPEKTLELAQRALEAGADALKIDVLATGFSVLHEVAEWVQSKGLNIPIFVYPALYTLYERSIRREVILYLARLCGADVIYAGTPSFAGRIDVIDRLARLKHLHHVLKRPIPWADHIKDTMPSVTAGLGLGHVNSMLKAVGHPDFAFFVGGGIAGNPLGPQAGARMFMRVVNAASKGQLKSADDYLRLFGRKEAEAIEKVGWRFHDWDKLLSEQPDIAAAVKEMRL